MKRLMATTIKFDSPANDQVSQDLIRLIPNWNVQFGIGQKGVYLSIPSEMVQSSAIYIKGIGSTSQDQFEYLCQKIFPKGVNHADYSKGKRTMSDKLKLLELDTSKLG